MLYLKPSKSAIMDCVCSALTFSGSRHWLVLAGTLYQGAFALFSWFGLSFLFSLFEPQLLTRRSFKHWENCSDAVCLNLWQKVLFRGFSAYPWSK